MLSVIIIAKNEEANLERCLKSVTWADEIIVLDSGSEDNTIPIAKKYTQKVYSTDWQGYGIQKQRALAHATGTWVLNLDADECVDEALKNELLAAIAKKNIDAYRIPIHLNFYGKTRRYSWSPKKHIRLFKREGAHYSNHIVHEAIVLPPRAKIRSLKQAIQHHCLRDISHALDKLNLYSTYSATIRIKKKARPSFIKTLLGAWWMFFRCYFFQGGFLEGRDGLILAILSAQGSFYRGVKTLYPDQTRHLDQQ